MCLSCVLSYTHVTHAHAWAGGQEEGEGRQASEVAVGGNLLGSLPVRGGKLAQRAAKGFGIRGSGLGVKDWGVREGFLAF